MPVEFGPYQSVYASQKSPEIAEKLRERYLGNLSIQSDLQDRLLELRAAPFSGDQAARDKLVQSVEAKVKDLGERGDYENMSKEVYNLTRRYKETATPIAQNSAAYQADLEKKQALLDSGKIHAEDFESWKARSAKRYDAAVGDFVDYAGVEFDDNGKVKNNSMYTSTPIAHSVDVSGGLIKALNELPEIKEGGFEVREYVQADGGKYFVKTHQGQFVERVPEHLVKLATEGYLARPDVSSYMHQQAEYANLSSSEEELDQVLGQRIQELRSTENPRALERARNLEAALLGNDIGAKRSAAQESHYNSAIDTYTELGENVRQDSRWGGKEGYAFDSAYTEAMAPKAAEISQSFDIGGTAHDFTSPFEGDRGVTTPGSINEELGNVVERIEGALEAVQTLVPQMQGMEPEQMLQQMEGLSNSMINKLEIPEEQKEALRNAKETIKLQTSLLTLGQDLLSQTREDAGYTAESLTENALALTATDQGVNVDAFITNLESEIEGSGMDRETVFAGLVGTILGGYLEDSDVVSESTGMPAIVSALQRLGGFSPEEAADIITLGKENTQGGVTRSWWGTHQTPTLETSIDLPEELQDTFSTYVDNYMDVSEHAQSEFHGQLENAGKGNRTYTDTYFIGGQGKLLQDELTKAMKSRSLEDFSGLATVGGEPLSTALAKTAAAGIEENKRNASTAAEINTVKEIQKALNEGNYQDFIVKEVSLGRSLNGRTQATVGIQFEHKHGGSAAYALPKVYVPLDELSPNLPGLSSEILGSTNTHADRVIANIDNQIYHAPGLHLRSGYKYTYQDTASGDNLIFTFHPKITNGSMDGYEKISVVGVANTNDGLRRVSSEYRNVQDFYDSYNTLMSK